jgi:hypothetical protein
MIAATATSLRTPHKDLLMSASPQQERYTEIYGRRLSTSALRLMVQDVATFSETVDRLLSGDIYSELSGTRGKGDLEAYWTSLFNNDLAEVILTITRYHYYVEADAQAAAASWLEQLAAHSRELLIFGALNNPDFLQKARNLLPAFSTPFEVFETGEPVLPAADKVTRLLRLGALFGDRQNHKNVVDLAYIPTTDFGIVTIIKWRDDLYVGPDRFALGINCQRAEWPVMTYTFNVQGDAGPLQLSNAGGDTSIIPTNVKTPSAHALYEAVMNSMSNDPSVISFEQPSEPNTLFFKQSR